ncbi:hypothetical protein C8Q77DRAFT_790527 [Trametes polyzona]|nr:hypothetical protein C8Q77DRAFT_790527 [Trametes polyzona]
MTVCYCLAYWISHAPLVASERCSRPSTPTSTAPSWQTSFPCTMSSPASAPEILRTKSHQPGSRPPGPNIISNISIVPFLRHRSTAASVALPCPSSTERRRAADRVQRDIEQDQQRVENASQGRRQRSGSTPREFSRRWGPPIQSVPGTRAHHERKHHRVAFHACPLASGQLSHRARRSTTGPRRRPGASTFADGAREKLCNRRAADLVPIPTRPCRRSCDGPVFKNLSALLGSLHGCKFSPLWLRACWRCERVSLSPE